MRARIKEYRKAQGLTQQELADLVGTSKSYVSEIEGGKKFPSGRLLKAFAKQFDKSVLALIEDDGEDGARLAAHIEVMKDLPPEDQKAVARHAIGLLDKDA